MELATKTLKETSALRWVSRPYQAATEYYGGGTVTKYRDVLQQAFLCIEDGSVEWRDVPHETTPENRE